MSSDRPRFVRRGNTSGLIGLWNQKVATEHSAAVDADSLRLRERAARRISARDPPKLAELECFRAGVAGTQDKDIRALATHTLSPNRSSSVRVRKSSEIVRPAFKIQEEQEGSGVFAKALLTEKKSVASVAEGVRNTLAAEEGGNEGPQFSFISDGVEDIKDDDYYHQEAREEDDDDDDDDELFSNKIIEMVKFRVKRRGSKTTDDIVESAQKAAEAAVEGGCGAGSSGSGRRGSAALGRSKSVRLQRVTFGIMPRDAREDDLTFQRGRTQ